jgi:hypothetical protein
MEDTKPEPHSSEVVKTLVVKTLREEARSCRRMAAEYRKLAAEYGRKAAQLEDGADKFEASEKAGNGKDLSKPPSCASEANRKDKKAV